MICIGPMGRLVARVVVVGVAAAVVAVGVAGCGGDGSGATDGPTASVPTTPPDPYAVPAVIDEAYVNRVLAALDQANGDVDGLVVSCTNALPPEAIDRLKAIICRRASYNFRLDMLPSETCWRTSQGYKDYSWESKNDSFTDH